MSNLHMGGGYFTHYNVKGFTLIELLAVIVILAIIALIATPTILGIIGDSREKAFRLSLKNVEHAYEIYETQHNIKPGTLIDIKDLPLDTKNLTGKVMMNEDGKLELKQVTDGTYSASGTLDDLNMIKGNLEELLKNTLTVKTNINSGSRNILVTVEAIEGIPTEYIYKIEGPNNYSKTQTKTTNTHTFDKLKQNTEYTIKVTVKNKAGLTKEITKTIKTLTIDNITLDLNPKDTYISEGKVTINYPSIEAGQVNKYKWDTDEDFTLVSGNSIEVNAQNGTLIAIVLDGEEVVTSNQITIENIDDVPPVLTLLSVQKTTKSITIPYSITENNIDTITCKYSDTIDTYTSNGEVGDNACTLSNELKDNKTYYYEICVTDIAGNSDCKTGSTNTEEITNPGISIKHYNKGGNEITTPSTTSNGYSYKEVAEVTFTNTHITTPTYYIKSTAAGTTNNNVIGSCTEENNLPKTCTNTSLTNIEANTWYKVSGDINITYTTTTETPITIYAVTYDGKNYSGATTGTTVKIETTDPIPTFVTNGNNISAKLQSSVVNITENGSGINTLKYIWTTSNTGDASNGTSFSNGDTLTTQANLNGTYYLCVYASDKVGNNSNTCSNAFKLDNQGPSITFGTNGNNTSAKSQSSTITVTNDTYGAALDTSSYKYIFSTNNQATPSTAFTSGTSYTTPANLTGPYYLIAKACDTLGNCTTATSNIFKLDNQGPTFTTSIDRGTVTINNASDSAGLHATAYKCGNNNWQASNVCTFTTSGTYPITVRDALENEASTSVTISLATIEDAPSDTSGLKKIVYYDPVAGKGCDKSQYVGSTNQVKTGCMKWYAFKEDPTTYTMILDHNTTAGVAYNSTGSNSTPKEIKTELDNLESVSGWKVKPRLITTKEVADITGLTSWTAGSSAISFRGTSTPSKYYWLYDYTKNCTSNGCKVADSSTYGYWTSTPKSSSSEGVWSVDCIGDLNIYQAYSSSLGLRPVITISKSEL